MRLTTFSKMFGGKIRPCRIAYSSRRISSTTCICLSAQLHCRPARGHHARRESAYVVLYARALLDRARPPPCAHFCPVIIVRSDALVRTLASKTSSFLESALRKRLPPRSVMVRIGLRSKQRKVAGTHGSALILFCALPIKCSQHYSVNYC